MREIKFRIYYSARNKMLTVRMLMWTIHGLIVEVENADNVSSPEKFPLMQYIGARDKKGKEIYEGDILLTDKAGWKAKVVFSKSAFILLDNSGRFSAEPDWDKYEIIGNIYENPELISPA